MIQYTSEKQLMLEGFETEFERWIDPTNKWVELSHLIPWDELSEAYDQTMSKTLGCPGKDARLVIITSISSALKPSKKNRLFVLPCLSTFAKEWMRKSTKNLSKALRMRLKKYKQVKQQSKNQNKDKKKKNSANKGTLIVDVTLADQDIRYPTDLSLLNEAREISEETIDKLYKQSSRTQKPRTYREIARKAFITCAKQKRLINKKRRQVIKNQLQYLRRNLSHIDSLLVEQTQPVRHQILETVVQTDFH